MDINRRRFVQLANAAFAAAMLDRRLFGAEMPEADVCVYGGTASGVAAAIGAAAAACPRATERTGSRRGRRP